MGHINLITGPNAIGKTNLVEAIMRFNGYNKHKNNIIRFGEESALVEIGVQKKESTASHRLVAERTEEGSRIQKKQPLGPLPLVYYSPANNGLFSCGPSERRHFLDTACSSLKSKYSKDVSEYQRVIKQKNRLLKEGDINEQLLKGFNEQLVSRAVEIIGSRTALLKEMEEPVKRFHERLSGQKKNLAVVYKSRTRIDDARASLFEQLEEKAHIESIRRVSLVGPHRDDFSFRAGETDVGECGSQGEKKSACLAFKMAQISLLKRKKIEPLLVLDDALSELDSQRRKLLMETIPECKQVFLTATDSGGLKLGEEINRIELS